MLPKLSLLLALPALLASSALAAPALDVPAGLEPRQTACPTTTRPKTWVFSTVWLATTTLTNGWSTLGSVTSTKTESRSYTVTTLTTVTSPAVLTLPSKLYPDSKPNRHHLSPRSLTHLLFPPTQPPPAPHSPPPPQRLPTPLGPKPSQLRAMRQPRNASSRRSPRSSRPQAASHTHSLSSNSIQPRSTPLSYIFSRV